MSKIRYAIQDYFQQSSNVISSLSSELESIERIASAIHETNKIGGKVLIAGNGGSCADAEHFSGELLCTFKARDRGPIGAVHLANNSSAITAWTNDFEFNSYFTRQVEALGNKGDILFLITTGGVLWSSLKGSDFHADFAALVLVDASVLPAALLLWDSDTESRDAPCFRKPDRWHWHWRSLFH